MQFILPMNSREDFSSYQFIFEIMSDECLDSRLMDKGPTILVGTGTQDP